MNDPFTQPRILSAPLESLWGRMKTASLFGPQCPTGRAAMDVVLAWMAL
jgi:hypothetical protein